MAKEIIAAVVETPGATPVLRTLFLDEPRDDEVLVRVRACGVCHTDMVLRDGLLPLTFPAVLGHEGAGEVAAIGVNVSGLAPGDRVVLSFHSCRACHSCDAGAPAYCEQLVPLNFFGTRPDGSSKLTAADGTPVSGNVFGQSAFATYALAYADNVVKVDTDLPFELLAPLGCGIQTGAGTVLETLGVSPGQRVAILGAGGVGLAAAMAAVAVGAGVVAVLDRHPSRLALARELGTTDAVDAVDALPDGLDFVIDTTGAPALAAAAAGRLAIQGTLALVGAYPPAGGIAIEPAFLMSAGRRIVGVVEGGVDPKRFVPRLVAMIAEGRLPIDRLVRSYPFAEIATAIADSERGAVVKPVLMMP